MWGEKAAKFTFKDLLSFL